MKKKDGKWQLLTGTCLNGSQVIGQRVLPWADSKQPMSWWHTENDVKIGLNSSDEKLHWIRQKVGEFLLDGWHQSLSKTEIISLTW